MNINYQPLIVKVIEAKDGLKAVDLALHVMHYLVNPSTFDNDKYLSALEGCIEDNIIIQFSYETPLNGTKVMYFPKGTKFWFEKVYK